MSCFLRSDSLSILCFCCCEVEVDQTKRSSWLKRWNHTHIAKSSMLLVPPHILTSIHFPFSLLLFLWLTLSIIFPNLSLVLTKFLTFLGAKPFFIFHYISQSVFVNGCFCLALMWCCFYVFASNWLAIVGILIWLIVHQECFCWESAHLCQPGWAQVWMYVLCIPFTLFCFSFSIHFMRLHAKVSFVFYHEWDHVNEFASRISWFWPEPIRNYFCSYDLPRTM